VIRDRLRRLGLNDGPRLRWYGGWHGEVPGLDSPIVWTWVEGCAIKPLIVVDSLIAFIGGDENDALVMRAFTHQARRLSSGGDYRRDDIHHSDPERLQANSVRNRKWRWKGDGSIEGSSWR